MAFTLRHALQLNILRSTDLIAGFDKLDKPVGSVFVLNYETQESAGGSGAISPIHRNGLALLGTYLDGAQLTGAVKRLILNDACALIVKGYASGDIPGEALAIADASDFPIFLLGQNMEHFEDISIQLTNYIEEYKNLSSCEEKVSSLMKDALPRAFVYSLGIELTREMKGPYYAAYCAPRAEQSEVAYRRTFRALKAHVPHSAAVQPFKSGLLFLISCSSGGVKGKSGDRRSPLRSMMHNSGLALEHYYVGLGNIHEYRDEMDFAIQESVCAAIYAKHSRCESAQFSAMGLYQMLLPLRDNRWVSNFCQGLLQALREYDKIGRAHV